MIPKGNRNTVRPSRLLVAREEYYKLQKLALVGQVAIVHVHEQKNLISRLSSLISELFVRLDARKTEPALLKRITLVVEDLHSLQDSILRLMRAPQDAVRPSYDPIPVDICLKEIVSLMKHRFEAGKVQLAVNLNTPASRILVDRQIVPLVLYNLLDNALKAVQIAHSVKKEVIVSVTLGRKQVEFEVRDNGEGYTPDISEQMWAPGFTTWPNNVGLGLTLVRELAKQSGGKAWGESVWGYGAAFHVSLPLIRNTK